MTSLDVIVRGEILFVRLETQFPSFALANLLVNNQSTCYAQRPLYKLSLCRVSAGGREGQG